jgi:hypothetical protein
MQSENIGFGRSEQDRIAQQQASRQDNSRQRAFEHQERLIAYQQANQDAVRAYQLQLRDQKIAEDRAIEQARQSAQRELQVSQAKTQAAVALRVQQEKAELQAMMAGGTARVKLEGQIQQALISQAMAFAGGAGPGSAPGFGSRGGIFTNSSFNQSRSVQLQQNNNFPGSAMNPAAITALVHSATVSALERVMR